MSENTIRDPLLAAAASAAGIETEAQMEAFFERMCGVVVGGLMVVKRGRTEHGKQMWQIIRVAEVSAPRAGTLRPVRPASDTPTRTL